MHNKNNTSPISIEDWTNLQWSPADNILHLRRSVVELIDTFVGASKVGKNNLHHPRSSTNITHTSTSLLLVFRIMANEAEEELLTKLVDGSIPHAYVSPRRQLRVARTPTDISLAIYFPPQIPGLNCWPPSLRG